MPYPVYRFPVRYAGLTLPAIAFESERGRDVIEWRPGRGDGARTSDRGRAPRSDTVTLQLVADSDPSPIAIRAELERIAQSGEVRRFSHPLDGQWDARIRRISNSLAAGRDTFTIELVEEIATRRLATPQVAEDTTSEAVAAAADRVDDLQGAVTRISTAAVRALVTSWSSSVPPLDAQAYDLDAVLAPIMAATEALSNEPSTDAWQLWAAGLELAGQTRQHAIVVRAAQAPTFRLEVLVTRPLLPLCAALYGARAATRRREQILSLNAIPNPLAIPAGTVLVVPLRGAA